MNDCCVVENCLGRNYGEEDLMGRGLKESSLSEPNEEKNQFTIEKRETVGGEVEESDNQGLNWAEAESIRKDKALTELKRKKRDRACREYKLNKKSLEVSELSGRSLSDTDISARWDILTKEARKALKLGKAMKKELAGAETVMRAKGIDGLIQESNKTTLLEDDVHDFVSGNSGSLLSVGDKG
ncbi:hypothetical protein V6N11_014266 [Hibiscus sabdariffa]|uniref:Uncharacterized protein n=1 Tax=Hibiscus sabdariffa TaxID=183260 RepID=A0ABR1ZKK7_9ROSI